MKTLLKTLKFKMRGNLDIRIQMSLIQKLYDAQEEKDLEKYNEVVSEDYYWVKHSTGEHIPRDELSK